MTSLRYEDLLEVADVGKDWYAGQGDPVYALVSSVYAGHDVPITVAEEALSNLERDYDRLRLRQPEGWRVERQRLRQAIDELQFHISEARAEAARKPNPRMTTGRRRTLPKMQVAGLPWVRQGPRYWTARNYYIRLEGVGYHVGFYDGRSRKSLGSYWELEPAKERAALHADAPRANPLSETWTAALVLLGVAGLVYIGTRPSAAGATK